MKLVEDARFKQIYDKEKDITTFEIVFPKWLKEKYDPETVKLIVNTVTPIIQEEMNETIKNQHIGTFVEGI